MLDSPEKFDGAKSVLEEKDFKNFIEIYTTNFATAKLVVYFKKRIPFKELLLEFLKKYDPGAGMHLITIFETCLLQTGNKK